MLTDSFTHWAVSALLLAGWFGVTFACLRRRKGSSANEAEVLVVFASQTGHAEDLAKATHQRLLAVGEDALILPADELSPEMLEGARQVCFVVSSTGEGDSPENARKFERKILTCQLDLSQVSIVILALGDRRYENFCAFGRRVDDWVRRCGAQCPEAMFEVDDLAREDLDAWDRFWASRGVSLPAKSVGMPIEKWVIASRSLVSGSPYGDGEGSGSAGLFKVTLECVMSGAPQWEVGDLFELCTPDGHLRDYSIASHPSDKHITLFVRRMVYEGIVGTGSRVLTETAEREPVLAGRVREHQPFRPPNGGGPLLAIGAGSGWAGLRPHLLHGQSLSQSVWLVFGDRGPDSSIPLFAEMKDWQTSGMLDRLDLALSQPASGSGRYVQTVLEEATSDIREFLGSAGCVVICGRLAMGEECGAVLASCMGTDWVEAARTEGRWRQDLY